MSAFRPHRASPLRRLAGGALRTIGIAASLLATAVCSAAPYTPASDSIVLERLPERIGPSARATRNVLARDPRNLDLALRVAQLYVARSRSESDPRLLGQAQAVLAPWWSSAEPPVAVLLLRATIRQSNHDFGNARRDLEQVLQREPTNAQAWLTLATVQQVTGDLATAASSCRRLAGLSSVLVVTSCEAAVDGLRGRALPAFDALAAALAAPAAVREPAAVRSWALTLQAELAERLGRRDDADRLYRDSLQVDPRDTYTVAAYADFLLDSDRAAAVLGLIAADTPVDILLLRRALAAAATGAAEAPTLAAALAQRFAASRARGDRVHLREEARFALQVQRAPAEALRLAQANWDVQKEPLDARVALEAAVAARQPGAVSGVLRWLAGNRVEGEALSRLTTQLRAL